MPTTARLVSILVVAVASVALGADPSGAAVALGSVTLDATKPPVHFIDVGPGWAVLIETPNDRKHLFMDGVKWGLADMQEYVGQFVRTATPIDIATHTDSGHYKGMKHIFDTYDVHAFWYTGYTSTTLSGLRRWGRYHGDYPKAAGDKDLVATKAFCLSPPTQKADPARICCSISCIRSLLVAASRCLDPR